MIEIVMVGVLVVKAIMMRLVIIVDLVGIVVATAIFVMAVIAIVSVAGHFVWGHRYQMYHWIDQMNHHMNHILMK